MEVLSKMNHKWLTNNLAIATDGLDRSEVENILNWLEEKKLLTINGREVKEEFVKSGEEDITKSMPNMYAIREKNLMEFFKNADEKTRKKMIKEGLVKEIKDAKSSLEGKKNEFM